MSAKELEHRQHARLSVHIKIMSINISLSLHSFYIPSSPLSHLRPRKHKKSSLTLKVYLSNLSVETLT